MQVHSGVEAYCKIAAELCGMPPNEMASWASFAQELFPDMPLRGPKATRIWSLSPTRSTGKSNRLKEFEKAWLDGKDAGIWADEAVQARRVDLKRNLSAAEESRCRGEARFACEKAAIDSCYKALDCNIESSMIWTLISSFEHFAARFHATILPALQKGFTREGFEDTDIRVFSNVVDQLANAMDSSHPLITDNCARLPLRNFIKTLFAALIYGPAHPLARNQPDIETSDYGESQQMLNFAWDTIAVTQLIERRVSYITDSLTYDSETAIFVGRSANANDYLEKCESVLGDDEELLERLREGKTKVFNVLNSFSNTSNVHGLILFNGNSWDYYDLESFNGTFYIRDNAIFPVKERFYVTRPGDVILLGGVASSDDMILPSKAAALLLSCRVDSSEFN